MTAELARSRIVDVAASMKPLTKMMRLLGSAASILAMVRDAFRVAVNELHAVAGGANLYKGTAALSEKTRVDAVEFAQIGGDPNDRDLLARSTSTRSLDGMSN